MNDKELLETLCSPNGWMTQFRACYGDKWLTPNSKERTMSLSREEIIRMAREAGLIRAEDSYLTDGMERFANAAYTAGAAAEREQCAYICDVMFSDEAWATREHDAATSCAENIRARGNGGEK